jgi:GTPase SAR1 family protein
MGNAESLEGVTSAEIDAAIARDKQYLAKLVKLLLLGTGESGKSTIVKQMKIAYASGFSEAELTSHRGLVFRNVLQACRDLIVGAENLGIPIVNRDAVAAFQALQSADASNYTGTIPALAVSLWQDPGIKSAAQRANEFHVQDSAFYFLDALARINVPGFVPTTQDVIQARERTTGIVETQFSVKGCSFSMVDVAGQRGDRRKWLHCFDDATAVVFVVGTSEYDQMLAEDGKTNRLVESLQVYQDVLSKNALAKCAIILFLNKVDILEEKIMVKKRDLRIALPDYTGGVNFQAAQNAIQDAFIKLTPTTRALYPHWTCATDTENISHVFAAITDTTMRNLLGSTGFI